MDLRVSSSASLRGEVLVPANKSHSFRALLLAGLARGESTIHRPALSADWHRGVRALRLLGAQVEQADEHTWRVQGVAGQPRTPDDVIDCGNSGIIFRFFTAAAALAPGYTVLTGDESIRTIRPIAPLLEGLNQLGAYAVSTRGDNHAPVIVRGPVTGGAARIAGADSQFVSALLIAAAAAGVHATVDVIDAGEKPWVALTLDWLARLGVHVTHRDFEHYAIAAREASAAWAGFDYTVPADWSAALYPLVAALVTPGSEVTVAGVDVSDPQPDRLVLDVLRDMGGDIRVHGDRVTARSSTLAGRRIDCNDFIDQFMLLAVVGCLAQGETELVNAQIARHKECDRIAAMAAALTAMGANTVERPDGLLLRHATLRGADLDSHADHRMVMTLSVAALAADGDTTIRRAECVEKTFADFPAAMRSLGAAIDAIANA